MTHFLYHLTETRLGTLILIASVLIAGWAFGKIAQVT